MARLRTALLAVSTTALLWSAIVAWTGGFHVRVAGVPVSSRDYRSALALAIVAALARAALAWWHGGWEAVAADWRRARNVVARHTKRLWPRLGRRVVAATTVAREREPWLALAPAVAVAIAGVALAIVQWADAPPLWLDEEMILLNVRDRSWSGLAGALWLGQSAPLGWLVVERAALVVLGAGDAALRLVPVLFGIGTVVVALWIGHRWMTSLGSAILVLLCAFGPHLSHYLFEAKHYSADAFWALLLPALAVWAAEGDGMQTRARRALAWWIVAAAGQAMANGALLVTPGCALFLVASSWRRGGARAALAVAIAGIVWLAAFAAHYQVALRFTHESEFLRNYWANEVPAASTDFVERVRWIAGRLDLLAVNPAGTTLWKTLWMCAALGLSFGARRALGLVFATVPIAAFLLAAFRLVPLHERFSLWIVPALYVGVALATDAIVPAVRSRRPGRRWPQAIAAPLLLAGLVVTADIYRRGIHEIATARPSEHKHSLNDRFAVEWLMTHLRPGDALMTTRLGWPAVWWYGGISIANADTDGLVRHPAGVALLQVEHAGSESECDDDRLAGLRGYRRVLVYMGFRDNPPGFEYLVLHTLDGIGAIKAFSRYSDLGLAAVFDLRDPSGGDLTLHAVSPKTVENRVPLEGCVKVREARRW